MIQVPPIIMQIVLAALVVSAGVFDIRSRRIPNFIVLPALLIGFALNAFLFGASGLVLAAGGFGLALLIYMPLYLLRGMGAGDVKLMAAVGALVGWQNWLALFIITGLLGGLLAVLLMLIKGRARSTLWNTGYLMWEMVHLRPPHVKREELDIGNPRAFTLPHGAVIALGTLLSLGLANTFAH